MAILSLPTWGVQRGARITLASNAARFGSQITGTTQSVGRVGDRWNATLDLPVLDRYRAAEWAAKMVQLAGGVNAIYMRPVMMIRNVIAGTPRIAGANQAGNTLVLDGFHSSDFVSAGAWLCYDTSTFRMLHMVTETTQADLSGGMSLPVRPEIRKAPADNALINFATPTCEMVLREADVDVITMAEACVFGNTSYDFIENVRN